MAQKSNLPPEKKQLILIVVALGMTVVGFTFVWMVFTGVTGEFPLSGLFWMLFAAIVVGFIIWGMLQLVAQWRIGKPNVTLTPDTLRVGESFTFTIEHTFKSNVNVQRILIQLLQRESATYRRGTDTYTVTEEKVVAEFEIPARPFRRGETLYDSRSFQIPHTGMHTFKARNNKIQWLVRVKIEVPAWPDLKQDYELTILPELVKEVA